MHCICLEHELVINLFPDLGLRGTSTLDVGDLCSDLRDNKQFSEQRTVFIHEICCTKAPIRY